MRRFAPLLILAAALSCLALSAEAQPTRPADAALRALAQERDFQIGTAVSTGVFARESRYREVIAQEFNRVVPENMMKFGPLRPSRERFDFGTPDRLVDWAEAEEMQVHGHTLVWHRQQPAWLTQGDWSREEAIEILRGHIHTVVGRYRGRVGSWDVVNEAVDEDGSLRETFWLEKIGPEYVALAFRWAHEADPAARLFYNDYGGEGVGTKSDAIFELVRGLLREGVPIHGVGLQMHHALGGFPDPQDVAANMERLEHLGLEVAVSEMDVRIALPASETGLAQQAMVYRSMLDVCLEAPNCSAFTTWGFTDRYSWIPGFFEGYGAALPFDEMYEPKPAYYALRSALRSE